MWAKVTIPILLAASLVAAPVVAQTGETPAAVDGAKTVTAAQAKTLVDGGATALDVRKKASFVEGRLPKARSIRSAANADTKEFDASGFGTAKDAPLVIYGHGADGWSALDAVRSAVKAGYTNVHWLRGGMTEWSQAGFATEQ